MDISYYKLVLDHFNVFLACFQKEVHWTPLDHIHIIRLSKVFKQNKIWFFFNKIGWLEGPWSVTSDEILLSKVTGRIGCHGTSSYGSTLAVGPKRTSECYHHEGPFSQNVCPIFGVLDTDTPLLSTRPLVHWALFHPLLVPHARTSYVDVP